MGASWGKLIWGTFKSSYIGGHHGWHLFLWSVLPSEVPLIMCLSSVVPAFCASFGALLLCNPSALPMSQWHYWCTFLDQTSPHGLSMLRNTFVHLISPLASLSIPPTVYTLLSPCVLLRTCSTYIRNALYPRSVVPNSSSTENAVSWPWSSSGYVSHWMNSLYVSQNPYSSTVCWGAVWVSG